ncbi:hypothetical protein LTR20_006001 [Exophiala xenobiotica]|nr:hypothetical protein LTS06_011956 [Exophiala xenobiotica]KAK5382365.1 hypothetical protein LTS13_003029 [Exophiala xenobiotica]KAK5462052.1 hypothetical protein LTR20_006001 [Exophiala xenobiotica]KAK5509232.1 hypothetical protein LTR21_007421 [Exophiala xenobiotica]KAK5521702.1 hypothetical protein LTR07_003985 [Exophiala xenobiotica]
MGPKEVVGTAALLYKHLLCGYPSDAERRKAVRAVQRTSSFQVEPYHRGFIASAGLLDEPLQLRRLRKQAAGMRMFSSHMSEFPHGWADFPDVHNAPLFQPEELHGFAVQASPVGSIIQAHTTSFGLAGFPVRDGDRIYQFSNTDFALVVRSAERYHGLGSKAANKIVGPALLTGPVGTAQWNPFIKSTDVASWFRSFEPQPLNLLGDSVSSSSITIVELFDLISWVCRS